MKKLISLLLCIAMLVSLCGCGGGAAETTAPPTTEPAPPASEVYAEAAAKLSGLTNVVLDVTYNETMRLGTDVFETSTRETVTILGLGSETLAVSSEGHTNAGTYYTEHTEQYLDGVYYGTINGDWWKGEMSAEDFASRLLPVALIDPSLYTTIEQTNDTTFTFTGSEILESWVDNNYTILTEATGTARLDANGVPDRFTYEATYTQGAADMTISVAVNVSEAPADAAVTAPAGSEEWVTLDTPEAPALLHMVIGNLLQANAVSTTTTDAVILQAAAFSEVYQSTIHGYGQGSDKKMKAEHLYQVIYEGQTETSTQEESYTGGVLTTVNDGGTPITDSSVTPDTIQNYLDNITLSLIPAFEYVEDFDLTFIGDMLLLEYTFKSEVGDDLRDGLSADYLGDADLIMELSTAYEATDVSGYIGIDASTGMPLSAAQSYVATHTVEGQEFLLSSVSQQKLQLANINSREAITGEPLRQAEPEEKASPVFYKVTGENGEQMWLLGTIHVGDVRTTYLPQEIYDAFDSADALALEFDQESYTAKLMEDEEALQSYIQAFLYTDGTTTADHMDETLYEDLLKLIKATGTYDATMMVTKPVFLEQTISSFYMSNGYRLSSDYGVDIQLETMAREQEKEILSVESGEFQMDMLASFSDELQCLMLRETMEYGQCAYNYQTEQLFEMWCRGDEAELIEYLNDEEDEDPDLTEEEKALYDEYEKAVEENRNIDMLEVAKGYLDSGKTVFYAVGLAHLLADDGLVNTLREAGYTVELVSYAE